MKNLLKLSLLLLALLIPDTATARPWNAYADGIYYYINGNEAEVTCYDVDEDDYHYYVNLYCDDVVIPATVTYNGITYPVTGIGSYAFYYSDCLTSVTIPNTVTHIGNFAFEGCSGLTSVTIPNSVTSIGDWAFSRCTNLTSITIGNSVESIGMYAFYDCNKLSSVHISDLKAWCNISFNDGYSNPLSTAHHLYMNGEEIKDLIIPYSTTSIGKFAFYGCSKLTSITISSSVTSIGDWAFSRCSGLTDIRVASGNPIYDSRNNCNAIIESYSNALIVGCKNTTIPNTVTSIGTGAFSYHSELTNIEIPNSVTSIGYMAFAGCSGLMSVTIPNSVTSIGNSAFSGCSGLSDVYSYITDLSQITMGYSVFYRDYGNYNERTLYVPWGASVAYQADSNWSQYFGSIVEMEEPVHAESIQLNVTTAGLNEGATLQLTATILPEGASCESVIWASNNPSVATVDGNGLVTTHSVGTATITAITTDGSNLSTTCTVTLLPVGVKGDVNGDNSINISDVTRLIDYLLYGTWY